MALVTGGARGIGFEVVRQRAQQGMTVILGARDLDKAGAAAEELAGDGLDVRAGTLDVTDGASVKALAEWVEEEFGGLDVLVNNAAAFADWSETASSADLESSRAVLDTNLFGPWLVCQVFLPLICRSDHGRIVNVASGPGADELYDAGGRNIIKGGPGNDSIAGHGRLFGGAGDDRIDGETGMVGRPRIIAGGAGEDRITSQRETDDTIHVSGGERDAVKDCGEGTDKVYFDEGLDEVDPITCENRIPR